MAHREKAESRTKTPEAEVQEKKAGNKKQ